MSAALQLNIGLPGVVLSAALQLNIGLPGVVSLRHTLQSMKAVAVLLALRQARGAAGDDELEALAQRLVAKTRVDVERSVRGAERIAAPAGFSRAAAAALSSTT